MKRTGRPIVINIFSGNTVNVSSNALVKWVVIILGCLLTLAISGNNTDVLANIIRSSISIAQSM